MVFPFVWMISTSFKQPADIYTLSLLPTQPTLDNYVIALTRFPFARWFANSLLVAGVTTLSVAFFDSLTGYVLAKLEFPFKTVIFVAILCTLMVPTEMLVIPWYILSVDYHWTDTYWGIMFPGVISAFGVFLMRQFMQTVPNELLDAGRIDGLGRVRAVLAGRAAAGSAGHGGAVHPDVPRQLECVPVAADRDPGPAAAHAPGRLVAVLVR